MANVSIFSAQRDLQIPAPHIIEIRNSSDVLIKQVYCKTDPDGQVTLADQFDIPLGDYKITAINPNLFNSSVGIILRYWNSSANDFADYIPFYVLDSGYSKTDTITLQPGGLLIETYNYAVVGAPLETRIVGVESSRQTAGNTLDGDAIPNGKEYFSKIKYVKLSTSTDTGLIIDNKKKWFYKGSNIDTEGFVPFLDLTDIVITNLANPVITISSNNVSEGTSLTLTNTTIYPAGTIVKFYEKNGTNYTEISTGTNTTNILASNGKKYVAKAFIGTTSSSYSNEITITTLCSFSIGTIESSLTLSNNYTVNFTSTITDSTNLTYLIKNLDNNTVLKTESITVPLNNTSFNIDLSDIQISNLSISAYFDNTCQGTKNFTHTYVPPADEISPAPRVLNYNIKASPIQVSVQMFSGCIGGLIKVFKNGVLLQNTELDSNGRYVYNGTLVQGEEFTAKQICPNLDESELSDTLVINSEDTTIRSFRIKSFNNGCNKVLEFGISSTNDVTTVTDWTLQQNSIIRIGLNEIKYLFIRNKNDINDVSKGFKIE